MPVIVRAFWAMMLPATLVETSWLVAPPPLTVIETLWEAPAAAEALSRA